MANIFSITKVFRPRRTIKSEDHNSLQTAIEAAFNLLGTAPPSGYTGVSSPFYVGTATEPNHAATKAQLDTAETGASASATAAAASATSASGSNTSAGASASAAATSETNAAASAASASSSASSASTNASSAATSSSSASTSASSASTSETNAAASASAASTSETNAAGSATSAGSSATSATASASAASTSQTASAASASAASTSETNAATSATSASSNNGYAEEWANKAEDSLVSVPAGGDGSTEYSAKHWAIKAADSAAAAFGGIDVVDLTDVTLTSISASQFLQRNAGNTGWENVSLAKGDVGLGSVDNTADTAKPVSTAQQTALDSKSDVAHNHSGVYSPTGHTHTLADLTDEGALASLSSISTTELDNDAVTFAKMQNVTTARILGRTTAGTGDIEQLTAGTMRTFLNVADGAEVNDATTLLSADIGTSVQGYSSILANTTASFTSALSSKLGGIEAGADVTDTTNVKAAGALMDSEVDANLKTFALPASTTISTFGASTVAQANATAFRSLLGIGTGNSVTFNSVTDTLGSLRNVPSPDAAKTSSYTLDTGDNGCHVRVSTGGSITVPDAVFSEDNVVTIVNTTSGDVTLTLSITSAYVGGTDAASATLSAYGVCTILFTSGTYCVISGDIS